MFGPILNKDLFQLAHAMLQGLDAYYLDIAIIKEVNWKTVIAIAIFV